MNFQIPQPFSRTVFCGMTGCGKTTLARMILKLYPFVVVYDVKGQMKPGEWPGFKFYKKFDRLVKAREPKLIYQPNIHEVPDDRNWDFAERFFKWIYLRKNTAVYIDEVYGCTAREYLPYYYKGILTRGRERNITCLSSTQRPAMIPQFILSESENYFVFKLQMPQDKKKVFEIKGFSLESQNNLKKHEFLIANETEVSERKRMLDL